MIDTKLEKVPITIPEEAEYQNYHWRRFEFAFELIKKINPKTALEIGPYVIAYNVARAGIPIDTMGYISDKVTGTGKHFEADLNEIGLHPERMLTGNYDLVISSEVIEHLYLDLDRMLTQLNKLTRIGGTVLLQTPNAVTLKKRIPMLFGKNPFEMIRSDYKPGNGGHVREFTMAELVQHAKMNGFEVVAKYCHNYFDYSHSITARLYKFFCDLMPPSLRDGITIVLRKTAEAVV